MSAAIRRKVIRWRLKPHLNSGVSIKLPKKSHLWPVSSIWCSDSSRSSPLWTRLCLVPHLQLSDLYWGDCASFGSNFLGPNLVMLTWTCAWHRLATVVQSPGSRLTQCTGVQPAATEGVLAAGCSLLPPWSFSVSGALSYRPGNPGPRKFWDFNQNGKNLVLENRKWERCFGRGIGTRIRWSDWCLLSVDTERNSSNLFISISKLHMPFR